MSVIPTMEDLNRQYLSLPEHRRAEWLKKNGALVKAIYDREKEKEKGNDRRNRNT